MSKHERFTLPSTLKRLVRGVVRNFCLVLPGCCLAKRACLFLSPCMFIYPSTYTVCINCTLLQSCKNREGSVKQAPKIKLNMRTEVGPFSKPWMNFALIKRCLHPSIASSLPVGIKAWAMNACMRMHDDRLREERKKRCFRADRTVIPPPHPL